MPLVTELLLCAFSMAASAVIGTIAYIAAANAF
jgi:hypothetical protein